ncbi:MAG: LysR family transcriptional regulator, partial [Bdellovibrionales bacterium]|nr:LysR family transcriptional regulator [Bdellovibrionales bacterium]
MGFWLNYHHLLYFKTIAEEGTVSAAAKKLKIGQPTLSAQLKQFESSLGFPLFERQRKRLVLSEHGKIALEYAKTIFKQGSEMLEALNDGARTSKSTLHIGALDSVPKQVILKLVRFACRSTPCQVTLSEGKPDELMRELLAHRIDLLVTNILPSGTDAKGILPRSISKESVAIYGTSDFK